MATTTETIAEQLRHTAIDDEIRRIAEEAEAQLQPINPSTGHRMTADDAAIFRAEEDATHHLDPDQEDRQAEAEREEDHRDATSGEFSEEDRPEEDHPEEDHPEEVRQEEVQHLGSKSFLTQWHAYMGLNFDAPIMSNVYKRCLLFLGYIKGPLVSNWTLGFLQWLNNEVQGGTNRPLVDDWKQTAYHGLAAYPTGEAWWDEFVRAFTAAWIDPIAPDKSLFAPRTSVPPTAILTVLNPRTPIVTAPPTNADEDEDWALFAPHTSPVTTFVAQHAEAPHVSPATAHTLPLPCQTPLVAPDMPRIEKRRCHDTPDEDATHLSKLPRLAAHAEPPRARPQLPRRSVPLPRKIVYRQCRATSAPVTGAPRFLVLYSPSPSRPPGPPGDPVHAPPLVDPNPRLLAPGRTVVEDDKMLTGGVKTLDDSVFAPVSAQDDAASTPLTEDSSPQTSLLTPDTADSSPQTPPHAHLFP
ncbi:hypothetical protein EDB89DRAFT_2074399 [Lactarius sanguifluus]|nr:hypothetical protein EDB89DRAFT_2074399 [Lactarius sanguifluus]